MEQKKEEPKTEPSRRDGISFYGWPAAVAFLVFILDQFSKFAVDRSCEIGWCKSVIPGVFNLVHYRNTGGAWGVFNQYTWLLALLSLAAFALVLAFFKSQTNGSKVSALALALLEGGIAGNMIDRFFRKSVIDFLDFYIGNSHWPAFNVADSAICVAMTILLIVSFATDKSKHATKDKSGNAN